MLEKKRNSLVWISGLTLAVAGLAGCAPQDGDPAWDMADADVGQVDKG